jgi:hypothetical protein
MEKVVQQMRKKIDGVSKLFTLDACRHGGMTELEEAELTDGQGRAFKTLDRFSSGPRKRKWHRISKCRVKAISKRHEKTGGTKAI